MLKEIEKAGKPYLFRYSPNNDFTLDEIENSYVYFQKRELLNGHVQVISATGQVDFNFSIGLMDTIPQSV